MSVEFGWRRFYFFDKGFVNDPSGVEKFVGLKDVKVHSWCSCGDSVFLGEAGGGVFRLNSSLEDSYWKAFHHSDDSESQRNSETKPIPMADLKCAQNLLFSVGEDDDTGPELKIWAKLNDEQPELRRTVRFTQAFTGLSSSVTAVAVHSQLTDVAAGFSDGTVLIYQGDVAKDRMSRWTRIREPNGSEGTVEGLAIAHLPGDRIVVFVILSKALYSYVVEGKAVVNKVKHYSSGATKDCWTFNERLGQLAIANKEMVYLYDAERSVEVDGGQGRCYQLGRGHEKLQVIWHEEYLVLLTKHQAVIEVADDKFMFMVTIYDIKGQYVAFYWVVPAVCRMFILDGVLMVLNEKDGTLSELKEKNLSAKLDILFQKKFFDVALNLAKNSKDGQSHLQTIHCKYGDHLYSKGDFENAINQYKETIGMLEPSYVMKRFHEENKLQQLCVYLEALHERKVHNRHQTEILLQTFARLGEKQRLLAFVEKMASFEDADMVAAFQIMREAKMSSEASMLAVKLKLHKEALEAMIDDLGRYKVAVKYIGQLSPETASPMIEKYGSTLLKHCPREMTELLFSFLSTAPDTAVNASHLLGPFLDTLAFSSEFISFVLEKLPSTKSTPIVDSILEFRLRKLEKAGKVEEDEWETLFSLADAATPEVALQLVRIFGCLPMEHRIMQRSERWKELAQFLLKHGELKELIEICKAKGETELWMQTISSVAKRTDISEKDIVGFLKEVEQADALHPLLVMEVLSGSPSLKISSVKNYVVNWLQKQNAQIERENKAVEASEKRMGDISRQLEALKFEPQVIQVNKCCACDTALQLPAVHFLCHHSYHVHCFESYSEGGEHCPACSTSQSVNESNEMVQRSEYGKFQNQMNANVNGMDILAKYLRMGIFDPKVISKQSSVVSNTPKSAASNPFSDLIRDRAATTVDSNPFNEASARRRPTMMSSTNPFEETSRARSETEKSKNPFESTTPKKPFESSSSSKNPFESTNPFEE